MSKELLRECRALLNELGDAANPKHIELARKIDATLAGQDSAAAAAGEERAHVEAAGVGEPECVTVLRGYQQADADGVMVTASRQAIDETLTYLDTIRSALRGSYEECARICEEQADAHRDGFGHHCAAIIRAAALRERGK